MTKHFDRKQASIKNIVSAVAGQLVRRGEGAMPDSAVDIAERELGRRQWFRQEWEKDQKPQILAVAFWAYVCHFPGISLADFLSILFEENQRGETSYWVDVINGTI